MRARFAIVAGFAAGVLVSLAVSRAPRADDFAVTSTFLFVVSLPWSIVPLVASWLLAIFRPDGGLSAAVGSAIFYSMPPIAGAGWGWLVSTVRDRLRARRLARG